MDVCEDRPVSRRDVVHVLGALWRLSNGEPGVAVTLADIEESVGRGHGDMRTPLELRQLSDEGLAVQVPEGAWAVTPEGVAWLKRDQELSHR